MTGRPLHNDLSLTDCISKTLYRARWAFAKVRDRDIYYVPRRLSYSVYRRFVDWTFPYSGSNSGALIDSLSKDPDKLLHYFRKRQSPHFHFNADETDEIVASIPDEIRSETIKTAEMMVSHQFTHKGVGPIVLEHMDWEFEPGNVSGWRAAANRHFTFTKLGFAYWYTRDDRFASEFFRLAGSWIDSYIAKLGRLTWDHPFEVGARINGWIWAYFLFLSHSGMNPLFHLKFLDALGRLSEYLYKTIEYHNPGNHIMLEAKALALCAGLFPEFRGAKRWGKKAWSIIKSELRTQVCPDGVHAERSTMYHRIVAGELAELMLFMRRNNLNSEELETTVFRMADFETWFASGQKCMPVFGDAYQEDNYYRFSAPAIAMALSNNLEPTRSSFDQEQTSWLLAGQLRPGRNDESAKFSPEVLGKAFPSGGYIVSRWEWDPAASVLVWDCGPVGYHKNPYHSHLDALSFNLTVNGVLFLIDPGIDEYDIKRNRLLKSTAMHNTVVIDGEDQSILAPLGVRTEIWSPAESTLITWATSQACDVMVGTHNGYKRLSKPVQHTRFIVSMRHRYWLVLDRIEGEGAHHADQRFHVAPGTIINQGEPNEIITLLNENEKLTLHPIRLNKSSTRGHREMVTITIEECFAGLIPNNIEPTQLINFKVEGRTPFDMAVILAPETTRIENITTQVIQGTAIIDSIEIHGSDFSDTICIGQGRQAYRGGLDGLGTNAALSVFRQHEGNVEEIFPQEQRGTMDRIKECQQQPIVGKFVFTEIIP